MRIAMVSEHASPLAILGGADAGGQNVHVAELSAALVRAGHSVTVYTRRDNANMPRRVGMSSGVIVEHVTAGPARAVPKDELLPYMDAFARRLQRLLAEADANLVHGHFWMSSRAALAAARPLGIPVVVTFHALGSEKRRMQGPADTSPAGRIDEEIRVMRASDRVIATSSSEIFELCRLGADPRRLKIVPCGVDVDFFERSRAKLSLPRRCAHRIVTLSRLVERKGVADVIDALRFVPNVELVVAGGPSAAEIGADPDAQRLARHATACAVSDRVTLLGRVERALVPPLLRAADAVVCAAWYEPFGIVPLEAMAAGVPVIATAVGGQNDTVLDRFTGLHVPPHSPGAVADAVRELVASPALRRRLGRGGQFRATTHFTWDRIASETLKVYREIEPLRGAVGHTA